MLCWYKTRGDKTSTNISGVLKPMRWDYVCVYVCVCVCVEREGVGGRGGKCNVAQVLEPNLRTRFSLVVGLVLNAKSLPYQC